MTVGPSVIGYLRKFRTLQCQESETYLSVHAASCSRLRRWSPDLRVGYRPCHRSHLGHSKPSESHGVHHHLGYRDRDDHVSLISMRRSSSVLMSLCLCPSSQLRLCLGTLAWSGARVSVLRDPELAAPPYPRCIQRCDCQIYCSSPARPKAIHPESGQPNLRHEAPRLP